MSIFTDTEVRAIEAHIDASKLAPKFEEAIRSLDKRPGRRGGLSVRTAMVGLMMLTNEGVMHLNRVPVILNGLDPESRERLGIRGPKGISYHQFDHLYRSMARAAEHEGLEFLDSFFDDLLAPTLPAESLKSTSIAIDESDIPSWGTSRRPQKRTLNSDGTAAWTSTKKPRAKRTFVGTNKKGEIVYATDPDAKWKGRHHDPERVGKDPVFGYGLTTAVAVKDLNGEAVPGVVTSMRLRPATVDTVKMGREVLQATYELRGSMGDVLFDRGYNASNDGSELIMPVRALGGEPVFDLYTRQMGSGESVKGALIIDGHPFSPSLPKKFHNLTNPGLHAFADVTVGYTDLIEQRTRWALVPHGSPRAAGQQVYMSPCAAGKLLCANRPSLRTKVGKSLPVFNPPSPEGHLVCTQNTTTFDASELPLSQRDLYKTAEWTRSYGRRNAVESGFGNAKNMATENLQRGSVRVTGLYKTGILMGFSIAAMNLRLADAFRSRKMVRPPHPRVGRPRKVGVLAHHPRLIDLID